MKKHYISSLDTLLQPLVGYRYLTQIAIKFKTDHFNFTDTVLIMVYAQGEAEVNLAKEMGNENALVLLPSPKTYIIQMFNDGLTS